METYTFLRQLADSWFLLAMTLFFIGVVVWAWRPGSRKMHDNTAMIPFRNETINRDNKSADSAGKANSDTKSEDAA
ncbi:cbb3-type cytochrome c oxidase subunit 3 [Yoonia sp.]|uniref:cbb3-type cytochrome c oxidase subunit 3 n=1 Tax=Yoonia sp. TaxID=2212373 RepID=UPI001A06E798|nr:cbb3-type cytochrome c oxidase subunit 3 [Yoonia sp.]MBE0412978.1 cbb3-type cytochrome c oxidase subunit 3 [Yoonia sp.]